MAEIKTTSSISLTPQTRIRLASLGKKNQSYDNLLVEILDFIEKCDQWWAEKR